MDPRDRWDESVLAAISESERRLRDAESWANRLERAIAWALGVGDTFRKRQEGEGAYWWRKELAERAGLRWNGESYVRDEEDT